MVNMYRQKRIILSIIILLLIASIIVIIISKLDTHIAKNSQQDMTNEDTLIQDDKVGTKSIKLVTSRDNFYIVENCIQKFINYLKSENIYKAYNCLNKDYINNTKLTQDQMKMENFNIKNGEVVAKKMFEYDATETITQYFVYSMIDKNDFYMSVIIDYENETFSIIPNQYIDEKLANEGQVKIINKK